jgi:glycine betaine/proline transport system ATP-binding protein
MQDEFLRLQRMLKKTIIFITHDFDEAIRLADRIGIMKDGVMVQLGTPEQLVVEPADDYVADFTKGAPKGKLISAARAMLPVRSGPVHPDPIHHLAKLEEVAARVLHSEDGITVVDDDNRPVGHLTRSRIIDLLFAPGPA